MPGSYFKKKYIRVKEKYSGYGVLVSLRKWHLSRDLNEGREETM